MMKLSCLFWKSDGNGCTAINNALKFDLCIMHFHGMLDYGEPKPRAADFFGVTLIQPVKAL